MRQPRGGKNPPPPPPPLLPLATSYSAFPPASPPPIPIQFPPPLPYLSSVAAADANDGSPTSPKAQSVWRPRLAGPARTSNPTGPVIATRHRAPLTVTLKRASRRFSSSGHVTDTSRMSQLVSPTEDQAWDGGRYGRAGPSEVARPDGQAGLQRRQGQDASRTPSPAELVGVAVTSGPDPPKDAGLPLRDRRESTIRLVGGGGGGGGGGPPAHADPTPTTSLDDAPERERRPPRRRPRAPGASNSVGSTNFPEWARAYYSRGARESIFDAVEAAVDRDRQLPPPPARKPLRRPPPALVAPEAGARRFRRADDVPVPFSVSPGETVYRSSTLRRSNANMRSPHLEHDRSARRLSMWTAPQVEDTRADGMLSRRRLQIGLFCMGFVLPFGESFRQAFHPRLFRRSPRALCQPRPCELTAWMIASFLPLPFNPRKSSVVDDPEGGGGGGDPRHPSTGPALSQRQSKAAELERDVHAIDEERYDSARWWRNLNRALSVLGLFIIGVFVSFPRLCFSFPLLCLSFPRLYSSSPRLYYYPSSSSGSRRPFPEELSDAEELSDTEHSSDICPEQRN